VGINVSEVEEVCLSSILKMEAAASSKMLVRVYKTTQFHIQEDSNLNIHPHEKQ
jgi:hypothetical protein